MFLANNGQIQPVKGGIKVNWDLELLVFLALSKSGDGSNTKYVGISNIALANTTFLSHLPLSFCLLDSLEGESEDEAVEVK